MASNLSTTPWAVPRRPSMAKATETGSSVAQQETLGRLMSDFKTIAKFCEDNSEATHGGSCELVGKAGDAGRSFQGQGGKGSGVECEHAQPVGAAVRLREVGDDAGQVVEDGAAGRDRAAAARAGEGQDRA